MTTIFYSVVPHNGHIIMYNPNPYDGTARRRTYIGYSLRDAKRLFKDYLSLTERVHWEEL